MKRRYNNRSGLLDSVRRSRRLDKIQELVETKFQRDLRQFKEKHFTNKKDEALDERISRDDANSQ